MKKLYDKNQLRFSLLWIGIYCGVTLPLLGSLGDSSPALSAWLAVLAVLLLSFIKKNHLEERTGLVRWKGSAGAYLWFLPVLVLATGNLWGGIHVPNADSGLFFSIVFMALVGLVEELIFRGLLFRALLDRVSVPVAVAISAMTFGLGHLINLLIGQGGLESLIQVIFATAWGFLFTYLFYKSGSLWICILAHAMIDVFSKLALPGTPADYAFTVMTVVIAIAYGLYLKRRPPVLTKKSS